MTIYDIMPKVTMAIEHIAQGYTKTHACDEVGISIAIFDRTVAASDELQVMLGEATERSYDAMADALLRIDNHELYGHSNPQMAKVMSDNIKWLLSKRKAKTYGDKLEVTHNITADRQLIDALNQGRERATLALNPPVIDACFTTVEQIDDDDAEFMRTLFPPESAAILDE